MPLKEEDAYPAQPQDAYGWEKLVTERLCQHYAEDYGLETRIVRFHNIFGPLGTWDGGREKAPAAMCRKVARAKLEGNDEIEIWGDGEQTRSFCYIDDCVTGLYKLMRSDYREPLNLGQDRMVTINELVDIVSDIAGVRARRTAHRGRRACGPQLGQQPPAQGAGLGARDQPRRWPGPHLRLDRAAGDRSSRFCSREWRSLDQPESCTPNGLDERTSGPFVSSTSTATSANPDSETGLARRY